MGHDKISISRGTPERAVELDPACEMVQNAAWIGFTDDYTRSICLMHQLFDFPQHPAELTNVRPGKASLINTTLVGILVRQEKKVLDNILSECALARHKQDLEIYAPSCL